MQKKTDPLHTAPPSPTGDRPGIHPGSPPARQQVRLCRSASRQDGSNGRLSAAMSMIVFLLALLFTLFGYQLPAAQSSPGSAAMETVKTVTGSGEDKSESDAQGNEASSPNSTKHPYKNREIPDSLKGWYDYLVNLSLYKTGGEWIRLHTLLFALGLLAGGHLAGRSGRQNRFIRR